jgi:hypothetical protein
VYFIPCFGWHVEERFRFLQPEVPPKSDGSDPICK